MAISAIRVLCAAAAVVAAAVQVAVARARPAHVLVIGIDGLGGDWLLEADAPRLQGLIRDGTATVVCQDVLGTSSSQNWFAMVGGVGPDISGVYDNGWERGDSNPPPTIFAITRDARGPSARIGCVYHWGGFGRLVEDDAPDLKANPGNEQATTDAAVEYILAGAPDLMFVHLDHVDGAGHSRGWGSQQYFDAIAVADRLVGELLDAYAQVGALANTTVIVSSDHGGTAAGSHGADRSPLRNIPLIISGGGVNAGVQIEREVRVFDVAATAAYLLDVPTPASWIATPVYEAFDDYAGSPVPRNPLRVAVTTNYTLVRSEPSASTPHSIWRPVVSAGYITAGDVAVSGVNAPTFATTVFLDDSDGSGDSALAPPAAYERIWNNPSVTYWQAIPSYGYTCVGTRAVTSGPSETEPDRNLIRCLHSAYVTKAADDEIELVGRIVGTNDLESGSTASLWRVAPTAGDGANSFVVRRDAEGPGYNKYFYLA